MEETKRFKKERKKEERYQEELRGTILEQLAILPFPFQRKKVVKEFVQRALLSRLPQRLVEKTTNAIQKGNYFFFFLHSDRIFQLLTWS